VRERAGRHEAAQLLGFGRQAVEFEVDGRDTPTGCLKWPLALLPPAGTKFVTSCPLLPCATPWSCRRRPSAASARRCGASRPPLHAGGDLKPVLQHTMHAASLPPMPSGPICPVGLFILPSDSGVGGPAAV